MSLSLSLSLSCFTLDSSKQAEMTSFGIQCLAPKNMETLGNHKVKCYLLILVCRVLKDFKGKAAVHVEWVKAWGQCLAELQVQHGDGDQ